MRPGVKWPPGRFLITRTTTVPLPAASATEIDSCH
jgi:hypothetical protein